MRIEFHFPSGAGAAFEGDAEELAIFEKFVAERVPGLSGPLHADPSSPSASGGGSSGLVTADESFKPNGAGEETTSPDQVARRLFEKFERFEIRSDVERLAVMAEEARLIGEDGLSYELADNWYSEMGLPKPGNWQSAFNNARNRGLVRSVRTGVLAPTTQGENLATHGIRPSRGRRRGKRQGPSSEE
jgi:hypothetical protein